MPGAIEGTRTPTPLPVHGPEPCASANSATMASGLAAAISLLKQEEQPFYSTGGRSSVKRRGASSIVIRVIDRRVR